MIEDRAVTCTFGVRPRVRRSIGQDAFGTADAIGPQFAFLHPAEAKAAIAMMAERGHPQGEMATACGCSEADIRRIVSRVCRPVPAPGGRDATMATNAQVAAPRRLHAQADLDRALQLIAAHAAAEGAGLDERFMLTFDMLAMVLGSSLGMARDRARALVAARLIDWRQPAGHPGSMLILAAGRLRLERLGGAMPAAAAGLAPAVRRKAVTRGRGTEQAAEAKAVQMLIVLDGLRAQAGVGPDTGFAASVAAVIRASALIDKTARNHLDLVIRQGWVARDASKGRCTIFTITPAGRAVLDAEPKGKAGEDA
ncbi:hypothetical protein [Hoeflea sp.]|uniref:hypothetical protein n=1 Tax=Hoeflea sp. TaxID=1940281 RepID=UPI0019B21CE6|nr:hypothetical protein [Hoeflea sp.]MBC7280017.1 hypothetical protein [Hoeflea sp.]